jgi:hypothetical protein
LAPHQAETLREVAQETAEENLRSPRVSWQNSDGVGDLQQYAEGLGSGGGVNGTANINGANGGAQQQQGRSMQQQQQDALAIAQNGGVSSAASDDGSMDDADDGMDDDMMDKISSSPSIEDGWCPPQTAPISWPKRVDSLPYREPGASTPVAACDRRTPPTPSPSPLSVYHHQKQNSGVLGNAIDRRHHQLAGEYRD